MIRPRTDADLDACVAALRQVQAADRYPVHWPDDPRAFLTPAALTGAWIAVEDGSVLGHVGLAGREVTRLFVTPAARGRGLAVRLLDTVSGAAGPLELEVSDEGKAAIALYERAGWRRVGSERADWRDSTGEPALVHRYVSP
ncbi:MAG: GNAT family N-acetyltransferase [Nonomuraea sp.]|nr:GNAT family N-acetyltransferase [Nonomuraea sp.]